MHFPVSSRKLAPLIIDKHEASYVPLYEAYQYFPKLLLLLQFFPHLGYRELPIHLLQNKNVVQQMENQLGR